MPVRYKKLFTATDGIEINQKNTVLLQYAEDGKWKSVAIRWLQGEYPTIKDFYSSLNETMESQESGVINEASKRYWGFFSTLMPGAKKLYDAFGELIAKAEEDKK